MTTDVATTGNHAKFLSHLDKSADGVWLAARWLNKHGYVVAIPPTSRAAQHADWRQHADDGDMTISMRVEVKSLGYHFTCREDWPFKDKFIVVAKHAWDRALVKPYLFIYLNPAKTHAAFILGDTCGSWTVETRRDRRYNGVEQESYFCPMDKIHFGELA